VEKLSKRFGSTTAVDELNFHVDEGEVLGLLGPNGAGKTTTVRLLACLVSPTGGRAKVCGFTIAHEPTKVRENVGILTENPCLYERLTAYENMTFFAEAYGVSDREEREKRIRGVLEFFDLWERRFEKVAHFSKGMKQKLAIARTLIHQPRVLLLDEPTATLDPESTDEIRRMIRELSGREKRSVLLCTHRLEDAEKLCHRVLIIDRGKEIASGTPNQLRAKFAGPPILEIELKKQSHEVIRAVRQIASSVQSTERYDSSRMLVTLDDPASMTPRVVEEVVHAGGLILGVRVVAPSLEDVYLRLLRGEVDG